MLHTHRLPASRFELKYVVEEPRARAIRDFARSYLVADEHADPALNNAYHVHSLYLDSPSFTLCRATMCGHLNRFKLRIRFYDEKPESPVFFEIKRRQNEVILKQRAAVRRERVQRLIAGQAPQRADLFRPGDGKAWATLQRFYTLREMLQAEGRAFVSYIREAYVSDVEEDIRVTFDRQLKGGDFHKSLCLSDPGRWSYPAMGGVVLEIKFTNRPPPWMRRMAEAFNLQRISFAKYVMCVTELVPRHHQLRRLRFLPEELAAVAPVVVAAPLNGAEGQPDAAALPEVAT